MTTTISPDGLLEIPEVYRKADALQPGQRCEIERVGRGEYRLRVEEPTEAAAGRSWVDVLLACPVKGWYEPAEDGHKPDANEHPDLVDWLLACPEKDWLAKDRRDLP